MTKKPIPLVKYKFGDKFYEGLGKIGIRLPVTGSYLVNNEAQIVDVYVPLLLELDVLSRMRVVLDLEGFTVKFTRSNWTVTLIKNQGRA